MLRIRKFTDWHHNALSKIAATRRGRIEAGKASPSTMNNPVSLQTVCVATVLDANFRAFAEAVGGRSAETFLIRVLQFAANGHALTGDVPIARNHFGPLVLSRAHDIVSVREGAKVYDALLASGIALRLETAPMLSQHEAHAVTQHAGHAAEQPVDRRARAPFPSLPDPTRPPPARPTPPGADAPPAADGTTGGDRSASPLSDTERRAILAGCASLHRLASAPADVRRTARQLANAISDGKADPAQAREFLVSILSFDASRMAYGMAKKA